MTPDGNPIKTSKQDSHHATAADVALESGLEE
jgi:hypothetical protein